jgi:hypothetical protein
MIRSEIDKCIVVEGAGAAGEELFLGNSELFSEDRKEAIRCARHEPNAGTDPDADAYVDKQWAKSKISLEVH